LSSKSTDSLFKVGQNCWKVAQADRLAVLVHGRDYFKSAYYALKQAKLQVIFLSWDIDSTLRLLRGKDAKNEHPVELGAFLNKIAKQQSDLRIHIVNWDYTQLFARSREVLPTIKFKLKTSSKVDFGMDNELPNGACHHQKVLVIDDQLAYCGGLDFTKGRWDTSEHAPNDPLRADNKGNDQRPYHDMSMMVEGEVAAQMGKLARERYNTAFHKNLEQPSVDTAVSAWPEDHPALMENARVAICRTWNNSELQIKETRQMTIDLILAAKKLLYIENQYLTADVVRESLEKLLSRKDPPEVIIVLTPHSDGWISQKTMDVLRTRLIKRLREVDHKNKLGIFIPHVPGLDWLGVNIHSKLIVVDDTYLRVGSSNLNNRSMDLDTECDLVVETTNNEQKKSLSQFRNERLAEHMGMSAGEIEEALQSATPIKEFIQSNSSDETRCLHPIDRVLSEGDDTDFALAEIGDPHESIDLGKLFGVLIQACSHKKKLSQIFLTVFLVLIVSAILLGLHFTRLNEYIQIEQIIQSLQDLQQRRGSPVLAVSAITLGLCLMVPLTFFVAAAALVFGSLWGFTYSFVSAGLSSAIMFGVGHYFGEKAIKKIVGKRINRISKKLGKQGVLTSIALRLVPIAPFSMINLVAGASHIKFRDFMLGTLIGQLPGMIAVVVVVNRLKLSLQDPKASIIITNVVIVTAVIISTILVSKKIKSKISDTKIQENSE
jgi:uncharacterized membrane protein YdjX (TVP38/TMEM64 family)/phosphatidylserine/phosphatidylglycerophosphate/cardiolipin synthase-like enzyme